MDNSFVCKAVLTLRGMWAVVKFEYNIFYSFAPELIPIFTGLNCLSVEQDDIVWVFAYVQGNF